MLSLNSTQQAIVASDNKKVSWLFTVVDSAGPTTYYWSTITRSYDGHDYLYKIDPSLFAGITLNRASSEINIQAPNDLSFVIENSGNVLSASNFVGGAVTLDLVISDNNASKYLEDELGDYLEDELGNYYEDNADANEKIIATWKFNIKKCEAVYQKLIFTCEDFIQQYLEGDYPNTQLIKDIIPSNDPDIDDDLCVPIPIGTCYIPLRSLYIVNQRYYLLGLVSAGTYTISKVRSPRSWGAAKSEWDSGSYSFTKSTKTIDAVNWRVFQAIIADSDGDGSADANGLWRQGDYFLDMPTKFSRSDTSGKTNPADAIEFILKDMGVVAGDIDTGVGSSFEAAATTYTSWGLTFNGAFYRKQSSDKVLALLLNMCHSTLQITDKIELHVLSKTSQKTITKADILRTNTGPGTFRRSLITEKQSDCGYIEFQVADEAQDEFIKKLVPAKTATDNISSEILNIPFVQDTQNAQRIGTLYYQRKFLKKANISLTNKGGTLLALQPDDVITINHADYGGNYPVLVNSMTIKHDLSIDFNCIQLSETLDDWTDLSPSVITPEQDDSTVVFNYTGNRVFTVQPYPPYSVGDLWVNGPTGDIKRCITARASGSYVAGDWELASSYDNTEDNPQPADWLSDLIDTLHIADDAIIAAKIAVAGLDPNTGNVAANHIIANMLQADCVTASKINVANLAAINANMGTITAGSITSAATYTGNLIGLNYTQAKCTDPNADQTSSHTANNTTYVNSSTNQAGSYINVYGDLKMRSGSDLYFYNSSNVIKGAIGESANTFLISGIDKLVLSSPELRISSTLIPNSDNSYDLGTSTYEWRNLYLDGIAYIDSLYTGNINEVANIYPIGTGVYSCGTSSHKWSDVWTVNQHTGDILFSDTHCPNCGKRFKKGDMLGLKVIEYIKGKNKDEDEIDCIPVHLECVKKAN